VRRHDGHASRHDTDDAVAIVVRPGVEEVRHRPRRFLIGGRKARGQPDDLPERLPDIGGHDEPWIALPGHPPPAVDDQRRQMKALAEGHLGRVATGEADEAVEAQRHPANAGKTDRPRLR
jgi:hypothetical protein